MHVIFIYIYDDIYNAPMSNVDRYHRTTPVCKKQDC